MNTIQASNAAVRIVSRSSPSAGGSGQPMPTETLSAWPMSRGAMSPPASAMTIGTASSAPATASSTARRGGRLERRSSRPQPASRAIASMARITTRRWLPVRTTGIRAAMSGSGGIPRATARANSANSATPVRIIERRLKGATTARRSGRAPTYSARSWANAPTAVWVARPQ